MSFSFDAFGRARVSATGQRLDIEYVYNKQDDYVDEITNNGAATHNANARDVTLSLTDANNGSYAKLASYPVPYTPGNSQLIEITGALDLAGIGGGTMEVFRRTSVSGSVAEEVIPQSEWTNLGSGVNWNQVHIFQIDFQSLKVGTIRFGLVERGKYEQVAQIDNDGRRNTGYWQLANGPVYWHLYTAGGITYMEVGYGDAANAVGFRYRIAANASATMKAICATVKSEGGMHLWDMTGLPRSADNGVTAVTASTVLRPIISVRPKTTFNSKANLILALPKRYSLTTSQPIRYALLHDTTLTGASWTDVSATDSMMEYDVTASAVSGGHVVDSGYVGTAGTAATRTGSNVGLLGKTLLWDRQDSVTGILTLAAVRTTASDASVYGQISWDELR